MSTVSAAGTLAALAVMAGAGGPQGAPTFRAESRLVVLHATVKNHRG